MHTRHPCSVSVNYIDKIATVLCLIFPTQVVALILSASIELIIDLILSTIFIDWPFPPSINTKRLPAKSSTKMAEGPRQFRQFHLGPDGLPSIQRVRFHQSIS